MAQKDFDRYEIFRNEDGSVDQIPFVTLPLGGSDKYIKFKAGIDRFDIISKKYYDNPFFDFLILMANPSFLNEFDIPDDTLIRIPFPLDKARMDYADGMRKKKNE